MNAVASLVKDVSLRKACACEMGRQDFAAAFGKHAQKTVSSESLVALPPFASGGVWQ